MAGDAFTNDLTTAMRVAEELDVGMVGINSFAVGSAQMPDSGVKLSGIGAENGTENGTEAMDSYLHSRTVAIGLNARK